MTQYYFVGTALPPLTIGVKPELSFKEFLEMLAMNLTDADKKRVREILWPTDLANIRALWMGFPPDEKGTFSSKELEEALLVREGFPSYLNDFLDQYESTESRLRYFPSVYASMYRDMVEKESGFVLDYYKMEREIRLILTALRAKHFRKDILRELQFEDPLDPLVAYILAQKDATDFTPPPEYAELKLLFQTHLNEPKQLHRALLEYRFKKVEELEETQHFSIDRILGYMVRLMIVESWESLDQKQGNTLIRELSDHG